MPPHSPAPMAPAPQLQFVFVLIESEDARNIGAAARAMNTMGHRDLRLVRPLSDHLSGPAKALAHGSHPILEAARVYEELSEAIADCDLACAATARHRLKKHHYVSVRELPRVLLEKGGSLGRVALVFGGETSGLRAADLERCDLMTTIPQHHPYPALNLAQAVMIYSFVFSEDRTWLQTQDHRLDSKTMPVEEYGSLKHLTLQLLARVGLNERYQSYVREGLARLGYEDLYLLHQIRSRFALALDHLEAQIQALQGSKKP